MELFCNMISPLVIIFSGLFLSEIISLSYSESRDPRRRSAEAFEPLYLLRHKRSKNDPRWPSNLETWQFNDVKIGPKVEASAQSVASTIADHIKCLKRPNFQRFTSTITLPNGYSIQPIFEDLLVSDLGSGPSECSLAPVSGNSGQYQMKVTDFERCGVKSEKGADGKEWISVSLRFPLIRGLQTMDDEHVLIVCRPQDPVMVKNRVLDFRTNIIRPPRTVFSSGNHGMEIRIGLFAKPAGMTYYSEEIPVDGIIEIGEDLQFRAIVKPGDGWNYARLKDLKVIKVSPKQRNLSALMDSGDAGLGGTDSDKVISTSSAKTSGKSSGSLAEVVTLVLDDGCRNSQYTTLAPFHPYRDSSNPLAVAFNFKAFMFQDMPDDGSIRITAKIMACVEEVDCAPTLCLDNGQQGYGRRKRSMDKPADDYGDVGKVDDDRRRRRRGRGRRYARNSSYFRPAKETSDFAGNFQVKVVRPGYAKRASMSWPQAHSDSPPGLSSVLPTIESSCKPILIMMASVAALLCSSTALAAVWTLRVRTKYSY